MNNASLVVVDTNVLSYIFKEDSRGPAYAQLLEGKALFISFQTWAEVQRWPLERHWEVGRTQNFAQFLTRFVELTHTRRTSLLWARVMAESKQNGTPILAADAWVAATALEVGFPVVTHNVKDFQNIQGLEVWTL